MRTRDLVRQLNKTKTFLKKFKEGLPNDDLYVTVHCVAGDTVKEIEDAIKNIPSFLKEARKEDKRKK